MSAPPMYYSVFSCCSFHCFAIQARAEESKAALQAKGGAQSQAVAGILKAAKKKSTTLLFRLPVEC